MTIRHLSAEWALASHARKNSWLLFFKSFFFLHLSLFSSILYFLCVNLWRCSYWLTKPTFFSCLLLFCAMVRIKSSTRKNATTTTHRMLNLRFTLIVSLNTLITSATVKHNYAQCTMHTRTVHSTLRFYLQWRKCKIECRPFKTIPFGQCKW